MPAPIERSRRGAGNTVPQRRARPRGMMATRGPVAPTRIWPRAHPLALAGLALIAVIVTNLVSLAGEHLRTDLLNANWEFSWSHDLDTVLLAVGAAVAWRGWRRPTARRRLWGSLALIQGALVVDELTPLHGRIGAVALDKLAYAPLLAVVVACIWRLTAGSMQRIWVAWGVGTLCVSFVMHVVGLHALRPIGYTNALYQTAVGFKAGTELAGLVLVVLAISRLAAREPG